MMYESTRGRAAARRAAGAILQGIAEDGGLFVPRHFPKLGGDWETWTEGSYQEVAFKVLSPFLDQWTDEELKEQLQGAYGQRFESPAVAPLASAGGAHFLELYHGPTAAFKDMALCLLPRLLVAALQKEGDGRKVAILTATSGDTGIAALEGFADVAGVEVVVFFPEEGVSPVQKQQMRTASGRNTHVVGLRGNFDDAQAGVKALLGDEAFGRRAAAAGFRLSAANSINVGRMLPQAAYYFWAYAQLLKQGGIQGGQPVNVVVPSGNFGNLLAAYYASCMGLPVNRFICASNKNRVLTDFFRTGVYDARRAFYITNAPSMDILISSNLERFIYHLSGRDGQQVARWMEELSQKKAYKVEGETLEGLEAVYAGYAGEEAIEEAIGKLYRTEGYLMDTHTAAAYKVYGDYVQETGDETPAIIASTASPYKFADSVGRALGLAPSPDAFQAVDRLFEATGVPVPGGLKDLKNRPIRHQRTIEPEQMGTEVLQRLQGKGDQ